MRMVFILVVALAITMNACSAPGDIEVHQPWARPTFQGENAAVYLTLHNHASESYELTGASSNVADVVEIHESRLENDIMQMNMLSSLPIAADEEINFAPGGLHIMLVNIKQELILGDHIGIILHFSNHEDIVVEVSIENTIPNEDHDH